MADYIYIIKHMHRHGVDLYPFEADELPDIDELIRLLVIDFEPELDEHISVDHYEINSIEDMKE